MTRTSYSTFEESEITGCFKEVWESLLCPVYAVIEQAVDVDDLF